MRRILLAASLLVLLTPAVAATAAEASLDAPEAPDALETPWAMKCDDKTFYGPTPTSVIGQCVQYLCTERLGVC